MNHGAGLELAEPLVAVLAPRNATANSYRRRSGWQFGKPGCGHDLRHPPRPQNSEKRVGQTTSVVKKKCLLFQLLSVATEVRIPHSPPSAHDFQLFFARRASRPRIDPAAKSAPLSYLFAARRLFHRSINSLTFRDMPNKPGLRLTTLLAASTRLSFASNRFTKLSLSPRT